MKHGAKSDVASIINAKSQEADIQWMTPSHGRNGDARRDPSLVGRVTTREKRGTLTVEVCLYAELMKQARLLAGDKVLVGYDKRGYVKLKRVPAGGFTLSPVAKDPDARKAAVGKPAETSLRLKFPFCIKTRTYRIDDVLIDGDTIDLPVEIEGN